jgi:hypothetical protein
MKMPRKANTTKALLDPGYGQQLHHRLQLSAWPVMVLRPAACLRAGVPCPPPNPTTHMRQGTCTSQSPTLNPYAGLAGLTDNSLVQHVLGGAGAPWLVGVVDPAARAMSAVLVSLLLHAAVGTDAMQHTATQAWHLSSTCILKRKSLELHLIVLPVTTQQLAVCNRCMGSTDLIWHIMATTHSPGLRQHSGKEWHTMMAGRSDSAGGRICMREERQAWEECQGAAPLPGHLSRCVMAPIPDSRLHTPVQGSSANKRGKLNCNVVQIWHRVSVAQGWRAVVWKPSTHMFDCTCSLY